MTLDDTPKTASWLLPETERHLPWCAQFEADWQAGRNPAIERFLTNVAESERPNLLAVLLGRELEFRRAAGDQPAATEYLGRFAQHAEVVKACFAFADDTTPALIGRYRVRRLLGGGGFGRVYLCFDDRARREVAVKVPRRDRLDSAEAIQAFLREARNVAGLDHPHIVQLYDVAEEDGLCFLVYKFIPGCSLRERMNQGPIPLAQVAALIADVAEILHYAHAKNLFHRDVKPGNILLDRDGQAYVTDFGLAAPEDELPRFRGKQSGTFPYMAPEQVRGEGHRIDGRTDIYSLGVVLYELLCGRRPFAGANTELVEQILHQDARPPRQIREGIPRELERICLKATAKQMSARYETAHDLAEDVRQVATALTSSSSTSLSSTLGAAQDGVGQSGSAETSRPSSSRQPSPIMPRGLRSFTAEDQEFFLELLPGPRGRDGLPDSLHFWKSRIESRDEAEAFAVGLIYGPSGCGKSSLVKAGLLPRLSDSVVRVYVEAAPQDTEVRLTKSLHKACPALAADLTLPEMMAQLRRGRDLPDDVKVLIVIDQFEQWLHSHGHDMESSALLAALRHADGVHAQALLLVRDDFWMGMSRLFDLLEINLDREHNCRAVDLFDSVHARRVLGMFGQAFDRLPALPSQWSEDQRTFLDRAVAQLSQDGRIISVRLSLFADLMKDHFWTTATLIEVGGAEGVGLRFLEETFSARTAQPDVRALEKPIRALMEALLPESGADIKGRLRSRAELAQACGLPANAPRFARLLQILDHDLHIITPAEEEGGRDQESGVRGQEAAGGERRAGTAAVVGQEPRFYQLTHDYLVQPLRQWLTQERRKTWRGRAELCLEERTAQWSRTKDRRFLPTAWECIRMAAAVPKQKRTTEQKELLRKARTRHGLRAGLAVSLLLLIALGAVMVRDHLRTTHAHGLVARLLEVETPQVAGVVAEMEDYRSSVNLELTRLLEEPSLSPKQRLHVSLALLPADAQQIGYLGQRLLDAEPMELAVVLELLKGRGQELNAGLWLALADSQRNKSERLSAACALAAFDPLEARWAGVGLDVAALLVAENPFHVSQWLGLLRPVRTRLIEPLQAIFAERTRPDEGYVAALVLAEYTADQPELFADLLYAADDRQLGALAAKCRQKSDPFAARLRTKINEAAPRSVSDDVNDLSAKAKANAAVALLSMGQVKDVWPLLERGRDPRLRTFLIHRLATGQIDPATLIQRLGDESRPGASAALLLALGEYPPDRLPPSLRQQLRPKLLETYRDHSDPGLHSAAERLLRHWRFEDDLKKADRQLVSTRPKDDRYWYHNPQGHTMVVIRGPVTYEMGSPKDESGRQLVERLHLETIPYSFAVATKEVTVEQYLRFAPKDHRDASARDACPKSTYPINAVTISDAARYCLWLSKQENIPEEEWCYEESAGSSLVVARPGFLAKLGYRLPTEVEWEFACRGGTQTSRHFGRADALLPHYAWFLENSQGRTSPVGQLLPNDFGLFDTYGNVMEWCHGLTGHEILRSGWFRSPRTDMRSAARTTLGRENMTHYYVGFRIVKTMRD